MEAINIQEVSKTFGDHTAVNNLSLEVPRGSIYGFIGPNGSGKTTTIRMIMNIFYPDRGQIFVLGEKEHQAARDRISYLPEERGLYKKMKVGKLLRYYGRLKNVPAKQLKQSITHWLERLSLTEWRDKKIEALSKGMSQKVQFISAVLSSPELLILDEPFSGLDPINVEILRDAILAERDRGATIVFSTHDMDAAEKLCDRIFMIFQGKKVLDGTLEEIQSTYGVDTILVKTEAGAKVFETIPEIASVIDHGNFQEVRLKDTPESQGPQAFLQKLVSQTVVSRFEVTNPSLDEIFKRIARPEQNGEANG